MPGGGQKVLVAVGAQNTMFNGNPEETKFYKVFKRHTHFSQENITISVDGPNELQMDSQIRLRAKIPRNADLLTDLVFAFELPAMYSKLAEQRIPAFRWIHQIGAHVIASVGIYIGGTRIQEFPGEWIAVRATADYPTEKYHKWRQLVGDVPELNEPEWGVYGRSPNYPFQAGEYPHAVPDAIDPTIPQAPSVPARTVRVPLPFWFTDSVGKALPLVALQLHEVEVQITLRSLRELFRIMEPTYEEEPCRPGRQINYDNDKPISFSLEPPPPPPGYNLTLQNQYATTDTDPVYSIRNYFTDATTTTPTSEGFVMNPRLEGNYVYVTEKEQVMFAERALTYMVHQVQVFQFPTVTARTRFELETHGLASRLLFFGRRSDAIESRNDYLNLTNWKSPNQAPFWPMNAGTPVPNSGRSIPFYAERSILSSARLLLAGNEYQEEKPASFFELQTPFTNATGAVPDGVRPGDIMGPIYHFPFALDPSDHAQPSGSVNVSRFREVQLEVAPTPLDPDGQYVYDFTVYLESMNLVKIQNGMGGLGWAI
jgi:hypothetical protein